MGSSLWVLGPRDSPIERGGFYLPPTQLLILSPERKEIFPGASSLVGRSTAIRCCDSLSSQLLGLPTFHLFS